MTVRPVGHHVLVEPLEWKKETEWGFQLTPHEESQMAKLEKAGRMIGTLIAYGPQAWKAHAVALAKGGHVKDPEVLSNWAQVGDLVMYARYAGKALFDPVTGQEYYLVHDEDIMAVFPPIEEWKYHPMEKDQEFSKRGKEL